MLLSEWMYRLGGRRRGFDVDLDEEIRFHMETRAAELEAGGLTRAEAIFQARREFGSIALSCEESRAAWHFRWLSDFAADMRHAFRAFRRSPAFTLTAVLSLALGIGATTAIVTALDAAIWRPIPVTDPERLVGFRLTRAKGEPQTDLLAPFAQQLKESNIFDGLILNDGDGLSLAYDDRAERIIGEFVSPNFFEVLGVRPILGQGFTAEVRRGNWAPEAVISYSYWKRRFGGDAAIVGRTIRLNTVPFTIVGVSPPGFFGLVRGTDYELRIPLLPPGMENPHIAVISGKPNRWIGAVARLKPGTSLAAAEAAVDAQFQQFLRTTPLVRFQKEHYQHARLASAARGYDDYTNPFRTPLYVLLVLVGIVLLIACSNVANMLLARASARSRELAVRVSIGAGRLRLIRQMLAESLLLAGVGGALALVLANWGAIALFHFLPQGHITIAIDLRPDQRALLFAFAVSLVTGVLFGLAPALQATRGDLIGALKSDTAGAVGERRRTAFRKAVLLAQVAFSAVLLIAAGVFVRTLGDLRPRSFRSDPERVVLFTMKPQQENYTAEQRTQLVAELGRRISALPGVQSASFAENGPLGSRQGWDTVDVPSRDPIHVQSDTVAPGFFDTIGLDLIAGRDFNPGDRAGAPFVAIVNQSLARALFGDRNPVGQMLHIPLGKWDGHYQVIGVVADAHYYDVHKPPQPFVWLSMAQITPYMPTLHVHTVSAATPAMVAAIRHQFDLVDQGFPIFNIRTMAARMEDALAQERMVASLAGAFGMLALVLAAVGLYGLIAYSVSRRTREIGIRMALGASGGSVVWMVAREALSLVGGGSLVGIALAVVGWRFLTRYMDSISPVDLPTGAVCVLAMCAIAAAAVAAPALRGSRIEPTRALRQE
jgi:predicted permease